jgi:hypothetical protein
MLKIRNGKSFYRVMVGDFETVVLENNQDQKDTEVWASAIVDMKSEDVKIFNSIDETFEYLKKLNENIILYYHNLKFDGSFWIDYLLRKLHFEQAYSYNEESEREWNKPSHMKNKSFKYSISEMGDWYTLTIKYNNKYIELRDSLKLLPFSVKKIGKDFKTKHQKLEMEYKGERYAGCFITDEEKEYIANDVLVIKEALEIMYADNYTGLTIGSCCLKEFKDRFKEGPFKKYDLYFSNLFDCLIDEETYGDRNSDAYIRRSYRGGWCYLVPEKADKMKYNGTTCDVNSLYPSVMHSMSGCRYPVNWPHFFIKKIPELCKSPYIYYFVRFRCRFNIKPGYLPFVQIKGNLLYDGNENLTTSDVFNRNTGKYCRKIKNLAGEIVDAKVTLTMTCTDFKLFQEHYDVEDLEILDGCWFNTEIGLFDDYINHYAKIKQTSTGARRAEAKLFLNNLYGKMAADKKSHFKTAYIDDNDTVNYDINYAEEKKPGYIAIGSAITSYAREFTIRAAQKNYHGPDKPGFIYADTDSIHCDLPLEELVGIRLHDTEFCSWKPESGWDKALFVRQKTYVEHIVLADQKPVQVPFFDIKCAGMPDRCKLLFIISMMTPDEKENLDDEIKHFISKLSPVELEFINTQRTLTDFKIGITIPGKLLPKRVPGGIILQDTTFKMLEKDFKGYKS